MSRRPPKVTRGLDLNKHYEDVRRIFMKHFGAGVARRGHDPEDVLQEVYRSILARNIGDNPYRPSRGADGSERLSHWVFRVCQSVAINYAQKHGAGRSREVCTDPEDMETLPDERGDDSEADSYETLASDLAAECLSGGTELALRASRFVSAVAGGMSRVDARERYGLDARRYAEKVVAECMLDGGVRVERLRAYGAMVIVAVLDLPTEEGQGYRGQIDPSTGLLMAGDEIHCPAGIVVSRGPRAVDVRTGAKIILQRIQRDRTWRWSTPTGDMICQHVRTGVYCQCGRMCHGDDILAQNKRGEYHGVGARVIVRPDPLIQHRGGLDLVNEWEPGDTRTGTVTSCGPDVRGISRGDRVTWVHGQHAAWRDGGKEVVSLVAGRRCKCGREVSGSQVLTATPDAWGEVA